MDDSMPLPNEILIHIFSYLSPQFLKRAACVNRRWNRVIYDDACWRSAFLSFYRKAPYRRLAGGNWQLEYTLRTQLQRLWQRGRCATVMFEPKIGEVEELDVDFPHQRLLAGSLEMGTVALCDPRTGRVSKDYVFAAHDDESHPVSCMKLTNQRVLMGHFTGQITSITQMREGGSAAVRANFEGGHLDAVTCFKTVTARDGSDDLLCSGSRDGQVKLWDFRSMSCLCTLEGGKFPIVALHPDPGAQNLTALNAQGHLLIWNKLDYAHLRSVTTEEQMKPNHALQPPGMGAADFEVKKLIYASGLEVAGVVCGCEIAFYDVRDGRLVAVLVGNKERLAQGTGHSAGITSVAWDIDTTYSMNGTEPVENERVFMLVSGDRAGKVAIWDGKPIAHHVEQQRKDPHLPPLQLRPSLFYQAHAGSVVCVDVDSLKVTSVGSDLYVRVWDVMLGRCLRTLHVRYFRHLARNRNDPIAPGDPAADTTNNRYIVRYLYTTLHQLVIAVNGQVKTWDLDPSRAMAQWSLSGKKKARAKRRSSVSTVTKAELRKDLELDRAESNRVLERERLERELREKQARRMNPRGMSEEELVNFAILLSIHTSPGLRPMSQGIANTGHIPPFELGSPYASSTSLADSQGAIIPFGENFTTDTFDPTLPTPPPISDEAFFPPLASPSASTRASRPATQPSSPMHLLPTSPLSASSSSSTMPIEIASPSKHPLASSNPPRGRSKSSRSASSTNGGGNSLGSKQSTPGRSRKMSFNEFMSMGAESPSAAAIAAATNMNIPNIAGTSLLSDRPPIFGSLERQHQGTPPVFPTTNSGGIISGSLGSTTSTSFRGATPQHHRPRVRGGHENDEDYSDLDNEEEEDEDGDYDFALFKNLSSPGGSGFSAPPPTSSLAAVRSMQPKSPASTAAARPLLEDAEDDELQYVLELSMVEK